MFALQSLVDSLSVKEAPKPAPAATTYERMLDMTLAVEDGLNSLDTDHELGMRQLEAMVEPIVSEVQRIELFLANLVPDPHGNLTRANTLFQQGLEAYYSGALELAHCLEDMDAAHLLEARRQFRDGHLALQDAKEAIEDTWECEADAA